MDWVGLLKVRHWSGRGRWGGKYRGLGTYGRQPIPRRILENHRAELVTDEEWTREEQKTLQIFSERSFID